jgi:hypothetical protein
MNVTETINFTGWQQARAALQAAKPTWTGHHAKRLVIVNLNAAPVTVHVSDGGAQPPAAADGVPVGSGAVTTAVGNSLTLEDVDLNSVWLNNAGAAMNVTLLVIGF